MINISGELSFFQLWIGGMLLSLTIWFWFKIFDLILELYNAIKNRNKL